MTRNIKKYPNRRLYDPKISSYITINDVKELIMNGEEIKVIEAHSGKDITYAILMQIMIEQENDKTLLGDKIISDSTILKLIRYRELQLNTCTAEVIDKCMEIILNQYEQWRKVLDHDYIADNVMGTFSRICQQNFHQWLSWQSKFIQETVLQNQQERYKQNKVHHQKLIEEA